MSSEHDDQAMIVEWLKRTGLWDRYGIFAPPNGIPLPGSAKSRARIINYMKREGMRPGVADMVFPIARGGYHGMYLELKRKSGGNLSDEQRNFIAIVERAGYFTAVPSGFEEAMEIIETYLSWEQF